MSLGRTHEITIFYKNFSANSNVSNPSLRILEFFPEILDFPGVDTAEYGEKITE